MKKFLLFALLLCSVQAFAGAPTTCAVKDSRNGTVATLQSTSATTTTVNNTIKGTVLLTETEPEDITVVVEAWDGDDSSLVGTTTVTIGAGYKSATFTMTNVNGIEYNKIYELSIADASCR